MRVENGGSCAWLDGAGPLDSFGGRGIGNPTLRSGTVVRVSWYYKIKVQERNRDTGGMSEGMAFSRQL